MPSRLPPRWVAIGIFTLSAALNYLDRQILPALAPLLRQEFGLSNAGYGLLLSAFSIAYAASAAFRLLHRLRGQRSGGGPVH